LNDFYTHNQLPDFFKFYNCRSSVRQRRNPKESADISSVQELVNDIDGNCHSGSI
jgi:hypothetical protein